MKKSLTILLVLTMVVGAFAGCGVKEAAPAAPAEKADVPAATGRNVEPLEVWVRNSFYDEISEAAKMFTESTGIPVNVTEPSNMSDDLALALSSGDVPDVVSIDCVLAPYYASIGALMDLTDYFNSLEYKDTFAGGTLNLASYEGKQYAVPFVPDVSVLLYNKDLFAANGLDPEKAPSTWDEIIEAAEACTKDDVYGYIFAASDPGGMMFTFGPYIWANDGDFTTNGGSESALNQPEAVSALQLITDMVHKYHVAPKSITSYDWTSSHDAFKAQKAAMLVSGSSAVGDIVNGKYDFNVGCCPIPSPDGSRVASFSGGDSIAIMAGTDKADAAWQFIDYCLSEEVQVDMMVKSGNIPARMDFFENEIFADHAEYDVLRVALENGEAPYSLKYNEMYTPWADAIQFALNQEKDPQQAFDDAKVEIDAILAE